MNDEAKARKRAKEFFEGLLEKIDITIVPNKEDPFNLDKAMVYFITEPDPYEGLFIYRFDSPSN